MAEKILIVFIDESGDFGPYDSHAPFYLVAMVLHNQDIITAKLMARISKLIAEILSSHQDFWEKFNRIIIYYGNGQIELTKILA